MRGNGRIRLTPRGGPSPVLIPNTILAQASHPGQLAESSVQPGSSHGFSSEYAFLTAHGVGWPAILLAQAEAARLGVAPHEVLLSAGTIAAETYAAALAAHLGVTHADWSATLD